MFTKTMPICYMLSGGDNKLNIKKIYKYIKVIVLCVNLRLECLINIENVN